MDDNRQRRRQNYSHPSHQNANDPFGGFGFSSSLFGRSFHDDIFNDPFFTQPFGSVFSSSPFDMFERHGSLFNEFNARGPARHRIHNQQQATNSQSRAPIIQELQDQDINEGDMVNMSRQEPIVEHPDEQVTEGSQPINNDFSMAPSTPAHQPSGQSWSYYSSTVTHSGMGGTTYRSSSTTRRLGPDGVFEEQKAEEDSSGRKEMTVSRAIGQKGRTLRKLRASNGEDQSEEIFHNISPEEAAVFDQMWREQAAREHGFPLHHDGGTSNRVRPALPDIPNRRRRTDGSQRDGARHA